MNRRQLGLKRASGKCRHDRKFEMAYFRHFILSAHGVAICTLNIGAQGPGGTTCSGSVKQFQNPESQTCIQGIERKYTRFRMTFEETTFTKVRMPTARFALFVQIIFQS